MPYGTLGRFRHARTSLTRSIGRRTS
ncbi:hypothetical protein J2X46_003165 [Nocardioides sp. BE266]|nr:hypothetical protein [Nocardioides sp. BE266]